MINNMIFDKLIEATIRKSVFWIDKLLLFKTGFALFNNCLAR